MSALDHTHAITRRSWVASANGHADFPIQNLPLGCFSPNGEAPRGGVAVGDMILDLRKVASALTGDALRAAQAASDGALNTPNRA